MSTAIAIFSALAALIVAGLLRWIFQMADEVLDASDAPETDEPKEKL